MGLATGRASSVTTHPLSRRTVYHGALVQLVEAMVGVAHGGQVVLDSATFTAMSPNLHELAGRVPAQPDYTTVSSRTRCVLTPLLCAVVCNCVPTASALCFLIWLRQKHSFHFAGLALTGLQWLLPMNYVSWSSCGHAIKARQSMKDRCPQARWTGVLLLSYLSHVYNGVSMHTHIGLVCLCCYTNVTRLTVVCMPPCVCFLLSLHPS